MTTKVIEVPSYSWIFFVECQKVFQLSKVRYFPQYKVRVRVPQRKTMKNL